MFIFIFNNIECVETIYFAHIRSHHEWIRMNVIELILLKSNKCVLRITYKMFNSFHIIII